MVQNLRFQSKVAGHFQRVAPSRNSHDEPVGWAAGHRIEFNRRNLSVRPFESMHFNKTEMGGDNGHYLSVHKIIENGRPKCSPFRGICTRTKLIDEHKTMLIGLARYFTYISDMRRKG